MSRSRLSRCATEVKICRGDLVQRVEQEVHRPVGLIVGQPGAARRWRPARPTQRVAASLRAGFQRPLRDQREHHPLDRVRRPGAGRRPAGDRRADPEPFPQPVQESTSRRGGGSRAPRPRSRRSPRPSIGLLRGRGTGRSRRPAGPARRGPPVGAAEVVDHLRGRGSRSPGGARCAPAAGSAPPSRPGCVRRVSRRYTPTR